MTLWRMATRLLSSYLAADMAVRKHWRCAESMTRKRWRGAMA